MRKRILVFIGLTVFVVWHVPAMGVTEQERLKALEDKVQALEDELLLKEKKGTPAVSFWKNDFFLSTPDEEFWMKIRGNLHLDTKFYYDDSRNPTRFDIRRARMDFQGMWYKYIYFRVQAEFADSPYIRNAWADFTFADWLHLRGGQMKPPFSTSWWTLDNRVNFLERGAGGPMYPFFDRGWYIWGDLFYKALTWNLGVFTGAGAEKGSNYDKYGDIDDGKDYFGRLFYTPFKQREGSVIQGLNLCLQGSTGKQSAPTRQFESGYEAAVKHDKFWVWQTAWNNAEIERRDRCGAELHYIFGQFSLSSEYLVTQWEDIENAGVKEDGEVTSWSTWVSCFLTGEKKQVSNFGWKQPNPKMDFDPVHLEGTGAWEVIARYTITETERDLFKVGILKGADTVDEYTVGLSWTWNPMIRWQLNYVRLEGNRSGIQTGSGSTKGTRWVENEDMIGLRMIFKF
jgi:phosphate-selective porin OprO/OprP